MFEVTQVMCQMLAQRWRALRADEGATAVEYAVILGLAFAAAALVAGLITSIVKAHTKGLA
jgi:Flp pilus assembly pilin Flp